MAPGRRRCDPPGGVDVARTEGPSEERTGGAPAAWVAFAAALGASVSTAVALALAALDVTDDALDEALAADLRHQSALVAAAVAPLPLETVFALEAGRAQDELRARLSALAEAGRLHDAALLGPGVEFGTRRGWVARAVDEPLIAEATAGDPRVGTRYRGADGRLYRTAYAPVPGHAAWVVGVEGSDETLAAVDALERALGLTTGGALVVATVVAGIAAAATTRPLRRLEDDLARATPTNPDAIGVQGPREVRHVARSARTLLETIHLRDVALQQAHEAQVRQLEALAAAVAHEVRNPLNALGMTVERLDTADPARRTTLLGRARERLVEIETIVERFLSLSRPIVPRAERLDPLSALRDAAAEVPELSLVAPDTGHAVLADPDLLRQVLRNLLRNAREAGARTVTVTLVDSAPAALDLTDDGPGLPDGLDPFEWFATTRAEGSGLGLPWSRRVARAMGGDLALLAPRPACFRLLLPRSPA